MAEIITKDCKEYRIWDKVNGVWNRLFFKTNTRSVEADDGNNLEDKIGAINGVTSDFSCEDETIVASMPAVANKISELNNALTHVIQATLKNAWGAEQNSFRVSGNTCNFNYYIIQGLNPMPNNSLIASNVPVPKVNSRFPCLIHTADTLMYYHAIATIDNSGNMRIMFDSSTFGTLEFKAGILVCGTYEINI